MMAGQTMAYRGISTFHKAFYASSTPGPGADRCQYVTGCPGEVSDGSRLRLAQLSATGTGTRNLRSRIRLVFCTAPGYCIKSNQKRTRQGPAENKTEDSEDYEMYLYVIVT